MGKHKLRDDMTCLNCRHVVDKRFCPNCGQENTATRKTFHHLFVHFFEDLTHYENAFWKTIRNLLFRPGALTREYLSGKRLSYLAPVRLYIFISFVTFLLMGVLPYNEGNAIGYSYKTPDGTEIKLGQIKSFDEIKKVRDSIQTATEEDTIGSLSDDLFGQEVAQNERKTPNIGDYNSVKEFDSIQLSLPEAQRKTGLKKWMIRRMAKINESAKDEQFKEKFTDGIVHNIPKALFLYMPFFALVLLLFHDKKRWYYFDHGIFTLHYFSFILLTLSIYLILNSTTSYIAEWVNDMMSIIVMGMMLWWFFYFFRSHRRFYGESKLISRTKGFAIFTINMFFLLFFMIALILYSVINIH